MRRQEQPFDQWRERFWEVVKNPLVPWVALGLVISSWAVAAAFDGDSAKPEAVANPPAASPSAEETEKVGKGKKDKRGKKHHGRKHGDKKKKSRKDDSNSSNAPLAVAGLSPCKDLGLVKAGAASGQAPVQYAKGWTPGPTKGCEVSDSQGRVLKITPAQNRMIYRVNEMRALQNRKDGLKRRLLSFDFCLQELAQEYTNTSPGGHNPFLMAMYNFPNGGGAGSGSVWIGENLGAHAGYTSDQLAQSDRLVYNWFTSGSLTTGHYGNMMDVDWSRAGLGILANGASVVSIQNFSADPAYYAYPGGKKCSQPPTKKYGSSTVPPIGSPPGF